MEDASQATEEILQYLTFEVADNVYAIGILQIREILSYHGATSVPLTPKAIRGLINLRGNAVPVIDLAVRFGLPPTEVSRRSCVVIADLSNADCAEDLPTVGILADSVSNVIELRANSIEPVPAFGMGAEATYLRGLAKVDEEFVPIIDMNQVVTVEDAVDCEHMAQDSTVAESESPLDSPALSHEIDPEAEDEEGNTETVQDDGTEQAMGTQTESDSSKPGKRLESSTDGDSGT